ncbi:unnamed protein product [Urochloa humidicola]
MTRRRHRHQLVFTRGNDLQARGQQAAAIRSVPAGHGPPQADRRRDRRGGQREHPRPAVAALGVDLPARNPQQERGSGTRRPDAGGPQASPAPLGDPAAATCREQIRVRIWRIRRPTTGIRRAARHRRPRVGGRVEWERGGWRGREGSRHGADFSAVVGRRRRRRQRRRPPEPGGGALWRGGESPPSRPSL